MAAPAAAAVPWLVAGGAALASGIGSGVSSAFGVHEQRQNRRFNLYQATHAHQQEVADLKLAGLNPILSAGGNGTQTTAPSFTPPENPAGNAAGTAFMAAQMRNMEATTQSTLEDARGKALLNGMNEENRDTEMLRRRAEYVNLVKSGDLTSEQKILAKQQIEKLDQEIFLLQQSRPEASAKANYYRGIGGNFPTASGPLRDLINTAHGAYEHLRLNVPQGR